jgi:hypothetical protein
LKILNGDKIVSTQLGTPFDILVSRLSVPDITRTVLLAVIIGSNSNYREYFVPFVTDPNPDNRARNILILLDFAEAVMGINEISESDLKVGEEFIQRDGSPEDKIFIVKSINTREDGKKLVSLEKVPTARPIFTASIAEFIQ